MSSATLKTRGLGARIASSFARSGRNGGNVGFAVATDGFGADSACENGVSLADGKRLYHDGDRRPPRLQRSDDAPTTLNTQGFDGSYISIVAELPKADCARIAAGVDLLVCLNVEAEPALPVYLRAHFSNEEGREVLHDLIVVATGSRLVRFDLDGLRIPLDLATSAWVDIIFSEPVDADLSFERISLNIEEQ